MLGSLEKRILSVLFKEKKATARDIFRILRAEGMTITYVTVNTVLSRLHKRGLVNRTIASVLSIGENLLAYPDSNWEYCRIRAA